MTHVLEWRWSDEPDQWRYDSHVQDSFSNPQQLADAKNANPARVPNSQTRAYAIWRVRRIEE